MCVKSELPTFLILYLSVTNPIMCFDIYW